eukprot:gnl/MRDRNA2_/MRDRNA2_153579_c0_seq1.p1 gnl/MRDRNA2_/MRDRNA2_153579_c0~~gnl/MRDRNA2_/MRDRNA2_153579_c0_seq1.p1  ORF type:complete len:279 (+),score=2.81 gnl/MRDRNA2_/MRDRNA2_153579_c0_seq1:90-839(+)
MVLLAVCVTTFYMKMDLTVTPLTKTFGYNNICIYWDYSPSREICALFYVFVEVPLVGYSILSMLQRRESYQASLISKAHYYINLATFPIELILILCFRMIFVISAFMDTLGHTAGFYGLQIVLSLVASKNLAYNHAIGRFPFMNYLGLTGSRICGILYVILLIAITIIKIVHTLMIFGGASGLFSGSVARFFDILWMMFAAVLPFFIAYSQIKQTPSIAIRMDLSMKTFHGSSSNFVKVIPDSFHSVSG